MENGQAGGHTPAHTSEKKRRNIQHIQVIQGTGSTEKELMNVKILVTYGLHHSTARPVAVLVRSRVPLGACGPLPMRAVEGPDAARQAPLLVARQDDTQLINRWLTQIGRLIALHNEAREVPHGLLNGGARDANVLVSTVCCLAVGEHPQRADDLLQRVCLQLSRCVDTLLEEGFVLCIVVDPLEKHPWHAEPALEVRVVIDGRQPVHAKVVAHDVVNSRAEVAELVSASPTASATRPRPSDETGNSRRPM